MLKILVRFLFILWYHLGCMFWPMVWNSCFHYLFSMSQIEYIQLWALDQPEQKENTSLTLFCIHSVISRPIVISFPTCVHILMFSFPSRCALRRHQLSLSIQCKSLLSLVNSTAPKSTDNTLNYLSLSNYNTSTYNYLYWESSSPGPEFKYLQITIRHTQKELLGSYFTLNK